VYALKVVIDSPDNKMELLAIQLIASASTSSPHVVEIYDYWFNTNAEEHIYRSFILMELCDGTLESYLTQIRESNGYLTSKELLVIMAQTLSGLNHCHEQGICHRDLKMSNGTLVSV
jgi:calcium-dependent protein kinase